MFYCNMYFFNLAGILPICIRTHLVALDLNKPSRGGPNILHQSRTNEQTHAHSHKIATTNMLLYFGRKHTHTPSTSPAILLLYCTVYTICNTFQVHPNSCQLLILIFTLFNCASPLSIFIYRIFNSQQTAPS